MMAARRGLKSLLVPTPVAFYGAIFLALIGMPVFVTARCDIVSGEPQLYGRVQNKEVLPKELWFPSGARARAEHFNDYIRNNMSAVNAPGGPPLPLRGGCNHMLLVNDKYKIIFLKNTKTAGTSLMLAFGKLEGDCDTCLRHVRADEEPELLQTYRDYFVFTIIRNPFDRAVSSYEYILSIRTKFWDPLDEDRAARCPPPTFQEFCERPYILALQDLTSRCYTDQEKARAGHPIGQNHDFVHVEPMSKCLLSETGKPAFDYAIRMDRIRDDFEDMRLHHLNTPERRKNGVPDLPQLAIAWTRRPIPRGAVAMNRHMSKYMQCGGECASSIANYYARDLELFGYPADESQCLMRQSLDHIL